MHSTLKRGLIEVKPALFFASLKLLVKIHCENDFFVELYLFYRLLFSL